MIQINSIVDTIIYLLAMVSGIAVIIFYYVYQKRYYSELAVVILMLTLFLAFLRRFLSTPSSTTDLLPIVALIVLGLAIIASAIRFFRKIQKKE